MPPQRDPANTFRLSNKLHQATSPYSKPSRSLRSGSGSHSAIGFGTPLSPIQGTPRANRSQSDARRPPLAATSSAPLLSLQDFAEPPSPTSSNYSFSSSGSSSSSTSFFSNSLSSKTSFSTLNSKDSSMTLASSFEEQCPATPKSIYARRPSLHVEGRLSCMSLHTTYATPESVERTGAPALEAPRSPSPMQKKGSLASLRAEAAGMDLDSPFNEEFPQW